MSDLVAPTVVADFLLEESRERGEVLTNLKLQKLLYYAQAWYIALNGDPLFEEDFQAWVHGPVLPSQYQRFRDYRWKPITEEINRPKFDVEGVEVHLTEIIDVFGCESAVSLELMTHREPPWQVARGDKPSDAPSQALIDKALMGDYYSSL